MEKDFNKIFPADIISDILSRLPAESVQECNSVCKTWNTLIHYPSFPQMHLARLNSADSGKLSYVFLKAPHDYDTDVCYFEYHDDEDWNHVKPIHRKIMSKTKTYSHTYIDGFILIGSFNGLICVYGTRLSSSHGPAIIFNAVTREYIVLPEFNCLAENLRKGEISVVYHHLACGFGYLAETNEYKVVRIYRDAREPPNVVGVEVYSVGSGKGWRHVGKFDLGLKFRTHWACPHGVFLNGCLHWRNVKGGRVVVFDLAGEKFCEHIPPPPVQMDYGNEKFPMLGASGGILYYAVYQSFGEPDFDGVWLLMKNGNHVAKEHEGYYHSWGWSKVVTLEQREPFCFTEGGTVLRYDQGNIQYFLSSTSTWENLRNFIAISRQVFPHKHTFVSLKQLGEEDAEILKSRRTEETDSTESGSE